MKKQYMTPIRSITLGAALCWLTGCLGITDESADRKASPVPPELFPLQVPQYVQVGQTYAWTLDLLRGDPELTAFSLLDPPPGMTLEGFALAWTPDSGEAGPQHFAVRAFREGHGADTLAYGAFVNLPPHFVYDSSSANVTLPVGSIYRDTLRAWDPNGDTLVFSLTAPGMQNVSDSLIEYAVTGGDHYFSVRVNDGKGGSDAFSWIVNGYYNWPPVIENTASNWVDSAHAQAGQVFRDTLTVSDSDSGLVRLSVLKGPSGMAIENGVLTWLADSAAGYAEVAVEAMDELGLADTLEYTLRVNRPPVFEPGTFRVFRDTVLITGFELSDTLRASDPDGDAVKFGYLDTVTGTTSFLDSEDFLRLYDDRLTCTPHAPDTGSYRRVFAAWDRYGGMDTLRIAFRLETALHRVLPTDSAARFSPRLLHASVVFDGKMWVIGGYDETERNDIWNSVDGLAWNLVTDAPGFSPRYGHQVVEYAGEMWMTGGSSLEESDVWHSADGIVWHRIPAGACFPPRLEHTSLVFDSKLWVIAGTSDSLHRDAWHSTDGVIWNRSSADIGTERRRHASAVYDGKMWLVGGQEDFDGFLLEEARQVLYSSDGVTWERSTINGLFNPIERLHPSLTVYQGWLWLIGGADAGSGSDIWRSQNGLKWERYVHESGLPTRLGHTALVFGDRLWLIGGGNQLFYNRVFENDVWVLQTSAPG